MHTYIFMVFMRIYIYLTKRSNTLKSDIVAIETKLSYSAR